MKQYVTENVFYNAFNNSYNYKDKFSFHGLKALFDYFENLEDDIGQEINFDMVAIACDYLEYESIDQYNEDFGQGCDTLEDIAEYTTVIPVTMLHKTGIKNIGFIIEN